MLWDTSSFSKFRKHAVLDGWSSDVIFGSVLHYVVLAFLHSSSCFTTVMDGTDSLARSGPGWAGMGRIELGFLDTLFFFV